MRTNKKNNKNKKTQATPKPQPHIQREATADLSRFELSDNGLWILTAVLVAIYMAYSFMVEGFYQQDEAAHYLSMRRFWYEPNTALGNWAKPGYKLLYALPSLLGKTGVLLTNCTLAALTAMLAYRIAKHLGSRVPLLAFVLLATQPFWILLSFRNYSEIPSAFLLTLAVYCHYKDKKIFSALLASYIVFIRQEFYPFLGLYAVILAYRKAWLPAALTAVFPLVHNAWGFAVSGDALYLLNQILKSSSDIGDAYPRQGFMHYPKLSAVIYGAGTLVLAMSYLSLKAFARKPLNWLVAVPALLYFLMYCIFNIQSVPIGPATAGNLRYLVIVAPLLAVLGALTLDEFSESKKKWELIYVLVPLLLFIGIYQTYDHNFVMLIDEEYKARMQSMGRDIEIVRDMTPIVVAIFMVIILYLPLKMQQKALIMSLGLAFFTLFSVKNIELLEEDRTCKRLANWYKEYEQKTQERPLLVNHTMFHYYMDRVPEQYNPKAQGIDSTRVAELPKGGFVIWDSHYSVPRASNPTAIAAEYFEQRPQEFKQVLKLIAPDRSFGVFVWEKQ
ncbi:MAG: hypothetical protein JJT94_16315 [Bernardetiaceae bacterium]|nr:hypothetical protein [Bernardetiaceae bacterium]